MSASPATVRHPSPINTNDHVRTVSRRGLPFGDGGQAAEQWPAGLQHLLEVLNGSASARDDQDLGGMLGAAVNHGLFSIVAHQLIREGSIAGSGPEGSIRQALVRNAHRNLALGSETLRLLQALEAAGLTAVGFKGGLLSQQAYGDLGRRKAGDIDLFVRKCDLRAAVQTLQACGYDFDQSWNSAIRDGHFRFDCECEMVNFATNMCVDLHWEFTAKNFSLPMPVDELFTRLQPLRIQGKKVVTFAPEDMVLILCLHAAKHHWHRLEWIFTIGAFIRRHPMLDWAVLLERANSMHLNHIVATGLRLVGELFHVSLPDSVRKWVDDSAPAARLAERVVQWIRTGNFKPSALQLRRFHAQGRDGFRRRMRYWMGVIFTPSEKDYAVELPAGFSWWYYLIRPFRLLASAIAGIFHRRDSGTDLRGRPSGGPTGSLRQPRKQSEVA